MKVYCSPRSCGSREEGPRAGAASGASAAAIRVSAREAARSSVPERRQRGQHFPTGGRQEAGFRNIRSGMSGDHGSGEG
jgi:hypothetical protein